MEESKILINPANINENMLTKKSQFHYDLPESLIAQMPLEPRDSSRLMILDRKTGEIVDENWVTKVTVAYNV